MKNLILFCMVLTGLSAQAAEKCYLKKESNAYQIKTQSKALIKMYEASPLADVKAQFKELVSVGLCDAAIVREKCEIQFLEPNFPSVLRGGVKWMTYDSLANAKQYLKELQTNELCSE